MLKKGNKYFDYWQQYPIPMAVGHVIALFGLLKLEAVIKKRKISRNLENIEGNFIDKWKKEATGQTQTINTGAVTQLIDTIHEKLMGANLYVYPEVVNKLTKLNTQELKFAYAYFNKVYTPAYDESLTQFLKNEMSSYKYAPAIGVLEKNNLL